MIDAVIQFTLLNIREIYRMEANEFFSYVDYVKAREHKRSEEIRKMRLR